MGGSTSIPTTRIRKTGTGPASQYTSQTTDIGLGGIKSSTLGVGGGGRGMGGGASNFFFGSGMGNPFFFAVSDKEPKDPQMATAEDAEVEEAARRQAELLRRRRRGYQGTIVTGPAGVEQEPTTAKTTLGA